MTWADACASASIALTERVAVECMCFIVPAQHATYDSYSAYNHYNVQYVQSRAINATHATHKHTMHAMHARYYASASTCFLAPRLPCCLMLRSLELHGLSFMLIFSGNPAVSPSLRSGRPHLQPAARPGDNTTPPLAVRSCFPLDREDPSLCGHSSYSTSHPYPLGPGRACRRPRGPHAGAGSTTRGAAPSRRGRGTA